MIQLTRASTTTTNIWRLSLYDKMRTIDTGTNVSPLSTITSQLTGNSKTYIGSYGNFTYIERYISYYLYVVTTAGEEDLRLGKLHLGTTDFPLGLYNLTVRKNTSSSNLDPSGLPVIYTGLVNLTSNSTADPVQYSEYTTNDSETESVYITF